MGPIGMEVQNPTTSTVATKLCYRLLMVIRIRELFWKFEILSLTTVIKIFESVRISNTVAFDFEHAKVILASFSELENCSWKSEADEYLGHVSVRYGRGYS